MRQDRPTCGAALVGMTILTAALFGIGSIQPVEAASTGVLTVVSDTAVAAFVLHPDFALAHDEIRCRPHGSCRISPGRAWIRIPACPIHIIPRTVRRLGLGQTDCRSVDVRMRTRCLMRQRVCILFAGRGRTGVDMPAGRAVLPGASRRDHTGIADSGGRLWVSGKAKISPPGSCPPGEALAG